MLSLISSPGLIEDWEGMLSDFILMLLGLELGREGFLRLVQCNAGGLAAELHKMRGLEMNALHARKADENATITEWLAKSAAASFDKLHGGWRRRDKARRE